MRIVCPHCDAPAAAEHVNMERLVATCPYCQKLYSFADKVPAAPGSAPSAGAPAKRVVRDRPASLTLDETPDGITLQRRWFHPMVFFFVFFTIAWCSFLVFWYSVAFSQNAPWIMKVFPIAHVAVGIGLIYFTLASLFNTTTLRVTYHDLHVAHAPIPWRGSRTLRAEQVRQISVKEKNRQHAGRHSSSSMSQYVVRAHTVDGTVVKLLVLDDEEEALYIEQELERFLGIEDDGH